MVSRRASQLSLLRRIGATIAPASAAVTIVWCASCRMGEDGRLPAAGRCDGVDADDGQNWPGAVGVVHGSGVVMMVAMMCHPWWAQC